MWSHKSTWSKLMWLYRWEPIKVGYHPATLGSHRDSDSGDDGFILSHELARPRDQRVMWLYGQKPITVIEFTEMEISVLISILTWISHRFHSQCWEIFKISNNDLQLRSPGYGWQKNERKEKNTGNCKALNVSHKRKKATVNSVMLFKQTQ